MQGGSQQSGPADGECVRIFWSPTCGGLARAKRRDGEPREDTLDPLRASNNVALLLPIVTSIIDVARSQPRYNTRTCFPNVRNHWGGTEQWLYDASNKNKGQVSDC